MKIPHLYLYCILALGFTLGIYRGRVALWKDTCPEPVAVLPLHAVHLPQKDQALLQQGIHAETIAELTARLEDYLS